MNVVGIIAEYNPMHNGHVYQIEEAKKRANADYAIIVMSGSFTQQGNVAIINKLDRATTAINCGADMVIELPTIHAISSSETFASSAVNILNSLGVVTHLSFGSECPDIQILNNIANMAIENEKTILKKTKEYMKTGLSSISANDKALQEFLSSKEYTEICKSNNILAIQYLCALKRLESKIKPVLVKRKEVNHNSNSVNLKSDLTSSTAIRKLIYNTSINTDEKGKILKQFMPKCSFEMLSKIKPVTNEYIWNILKYSIITKGPIRLKEIYEVNEGLENRIYEIALKSNSYEQFIFNVKCKRYTLSRIKRICIYILLNLTKNMAKNLSNVSYARILKVKKESLSLLSLISNNSNIPVITKVTDELLINLDVKIADSIKLDILSSNISNLNNYNEIQNDYTNNITK